MRILGCLVLLAAGCMVGDATTDPGDNGGGGGGGGSDTGGGGGDSGGGGSNAAACPLPDTAGDTGPLTAFKAQMCNVPGSAGAQQWYRLSAVLPSGAMDYVQLELWPASGAFTGGAVHTGTFQITGDEADYNKCGVCVRGIGDKGAAGSKEYFASGGTVTVDAVGASGQPISATLTNITFIEVNPSTHAAVTGGCQAAVAGTKVSGTVQAVTGGGGGGGGGGGACPGGVGD